MILGDIGGINTYLSLIKLSRDKNSNPEEIYTKKLSPNIYTSLADLLKDYLSNIPKENYPLFAVFCIHDTVKNNEVLHIKNIPNWPKFNGNELAKMFNIKRFILLNEFTCNGYGVQTDLKSGEDYIIINKAKQEKDGPKFVIDSDEGVGMRYLIKDHRSDFYIIGTSEGGLKDYTAKTKDNYELREYFKQTLGNKEISIERILSGQGLIIIYKYLKYNGPTIKGDKDLEDKIDKFDDLSTKPSSNKIITELVKKGLNGECELCKKVLEYFIEILGNVIGDIALFFHPDGGLYLTGGLIIDLEPLIHGTNIFIEHYLKKDTFKYLLEEIPIYLVKSRNLGILGARECARRLILQYK